MRWHHYLALALLAPAMLLSSALVGVPGAGAAATEQEQSDAFSTWSGTLTLSDRPASRRAPSTSAAASVAANMTEGFEGSWPAPGWTVSGSSASDGGEYLWGKRSCHPHTGASAAWSVGGGAQGAGLGCSGEYPNNTVSEAVYGPFDLSGATSASLTFHLWGATEAAVDSTGHPVDFVFVGSSIDGSSFGGVAYYGTITGGVDGNGYIRRTLDLSARLGQPQVWIILAFRSDSSVTNIGITIDDVALTARASTPPTVTPVTPSPPTVTPVTPSPRATNTPTPTRIGAAPGGNRYLPIVAYAPAPTATPPPTAIPPTVQPTKTSGNHVPYFPQPLSVSQSTHFQYDSLGRLIGAVTDITLNTPAVDPDGDRLTYGWSATNGSISGSGLTATWTRIIQYGDVAGGTVTVMASDGRGGTATLRLNFY